MAVAAAIAGTGLKSDKPTVPIVANDGGKVATERTESRRNQLDRARMAVVLSLSFGEKLYPHPTIMRQRLEYELTAMKAASKDKADILKRFDDATPQSWGDAFDVLCGTTAYLTDLMNEAD